MENLRRLKTVENTRNSKTIYTSGGGTNIQILEEGTAKLSLISGAQQNTFYKKSHEMKKENLNKLNEVRNTPVLHHADFDEVKMELMNELQKGRNTALSRYVERSKNNRDFYLFELNIKPPLKLNSDRSAFVK